MIASTASNRSLSERLGSPRSSNTSLLELAYKLRQAEFRVFGIPADNEKSVMMTKETTPQEKSLEQHSDDRLKERTREHPCIANSTAPFPSSLDLTFDEATTDISLKSIQDRYRSFRASFPRYTESETADSDNCNYISVSDTNTSPQKDNRTTNASQKMFAPQKAVDIELPKRHSCEWCSYQTDSKSHLLRHLKAVHNNVEKTDIPTHDVSLDMRSFPNKTSVVKRKSSCNLTIRRFKCDMCVYSTDCLSHLRRHQGCVHNKMMSYWCYICKKEFSRSEKTKAHFLAFHPNIPYDPRKIRKFSPQPRSKLKTVSEICNKMEHQKEVEEDKKEAEIEKGTKPETHQVEAQNGHLVKSPQKKSEQEINFKVNDVSSYSRLSEVQESHGNNDTKKKGFSKGREKQYACLKCNYVSHGQWHMKRHMADVHGTAKEFTCKVCCYAASRQHRIVSHMQSHDEMFCLFCDYSNANMEVFKRHFNLCTALHRVNTVTSCSVCQIDCKDPKQLKAHINELHSVILHSCDLCPYYTDIPDEIYSHARLHVEDDLTCKLCNVLFTTDDQLNCHVEAKHITQSSDRCWVCTICSHEEQEFADIICHVQAHGPEVLGCGYDRCNFKCTVENSRQLHWRYYHDFEKPGPVAIIHESNPESEPMSTSNS